MLVSRLSLKIELKLEGLVMRCMSYFCLSHPSTPIIHSPPPIIHPLSSMITTKIQKLIPAILQYQRGIALRFLSNLSFLSIDWMYRSSFHSCSFGIESRSGYKRKGKERVCGCNPTIKLSEWLRRKVWKEALKRKRSALLNLSIASGYHDSIGRGQILVIF